MKTRTIIILIYLAVLGGCAKAYPIVPPRSGMLMYTRVHRRSQTFPWQ